MLNPILVKQYEVENSDLHELLLLPRAICKDSNYKCCSSCYLYWGPPSEKHREQSLQSMSLQMDLLLVTFCWSFFVNGEADPRQTGLTSTRINDVINDVIARQHPSSFIFELFGGHINLLWDSTHFWDRKILLSDPSIITEKLEPMIAYW